VFSPADFERPPKPRSSPFWDNRVVGTIMLVCGLLLLMLMATNYDQQIFIPFNATQAVTQTWQAQQSPTPTVRNTRRATPQPPRRTPRRDRDLQSASYPISRS
jgi:hypothetical protein